MLNKPINTEKFLATLNPDDHPRYERTWFTFTLSGYLAEATDEMIEAAFAAWNHWSRTPSIEVDHEVNMGCMGVNHVIQQAMSERPHQADELAERAVGYFSSENLDVCVTAAVLFQHRPDLMPIAEEGLAVLASSDSPHPIPPPDSNNLTLRAKAFQILYINRAIYVYDPHMKTARNEYATSMRSWAKTPEEKEEAEELLDNLY